MFFRILVRLGKRATGFHVKIQKKLQIFNLVWVHDCSSAIP